MSERLDYADELKEEPLSRRQGGHGVIDVKAKEDLEMACRRVPPQSGAGTSFAFFSWRHVGFFSSRWLADRASPAGGKTDSGQSHTLEIPTRANLSATVVVIDLSMANRPGPGRGVRRTGLECSKLFQILVTFRWS